MLCFTACSFLFTNRIIINKEGTPSWQEPVPSFIKYIPKEVSKYYDTHFQSVLQAERNKNIRPGVVCPGGWSPDAFGPVLPILWGKRQHETP